MGKLLFWIAAIVVAMIAIRLVNLKNSKRSKPSAPDGKINKHSAQKMVRCANCGIYLPRSEAYLEDNKTWCCPEHAQKGSTYHA